MLHVMAMVIGMVELGMLVTVVMMVAVEMIILLAQTPMPKYICVKFQICHSLFMWPRKATWHPFFNISPIKYECCPRVDKSKCVSQNVSTVNGIWWPHSCEMQMSEHSDHNREHTHTNSSICLYCKLRNWRTKSFSLSLKCSLEAHVLTVAGSTTGSNGNF